MSYAEALYLLRCYAQVGDHIEQRPLAEIVIETAHALNLTTAFAQRGAGGFGQHGQIVNPILLEVRPTQQPVIIQVLGRRSQLDLLLSHLENLDLPSRLWLLEPLIA